MILGSFSISGGDDGNRTHDPLLAGQVLSQLSYTPSEGLPFFKDLPDFRRVTIPENQTTKVPFLLASASFRSLPFPTCDRPVMICHGLHRKEVIQPHLPIRLPCYDLTPIIEPAFDGCLLAVSSPASGVFNFHGLTGGVYKARERIHRGMLIRDY